MNKEPLQFTVDEYLQLLTRLERIKFERAIDTLSLDMVFDEDIINDYIDELKTSMKNLLEARQNYYETYKRVNNIQGRITKRVPYHP